MSRRAPSRQEPVVLLTGPAGSGKSTLALLWAAAQSRPAVVVDHDAVKAFVKHGAADVSRGWTPAVARQWTVARDACVDIAQRYIAEGMACLIEAFASPDDAELGFPRWRELLSPADVRPVVLLPQFSIIQQRNADRRRQKQLMPAVLETNYAVASRWLATDVGIVIDNTALTPEATLMALQRGLLEATP